LTLESLRSTAVLILDPFVKAFETHNISANSLTFLSLIFAMLAGTCYYFSLNNPWVLFAALIFVFMNAFLDGADGLLARKTNSASKYGDFWTTSSTGMPTCSSSEARASPGSWSPPSASSFCPGIACQLPGHSGSGCGHWPGLRRYHGAGGPAYHPDDGHFPEYRLRAFFRAPGRGVQRARVGDHRHRPRQPHHGISAYLAYQENAAGRRK